MNNGNIQEIFACTYIRNFHLKVEQNVWNDKEINIRSMRWAKNDVTFSLVNYVFESINHDWIDANVIVNFSPNFSNDEGKQSDCSITHCRLHSVNNLISPQNLHFISLILWKRHTCLLMCNLSHHLHHLVRVQQILLHSFWSSNVLLLSMVERPVVVVEGFLTQAEHVVHLFEVDVRVAVSEELEPADGKTEDEVTPVKFCEVEAKDLLVFRGDFLIQSLASIAVKNPFAPPEEPKSREKGVDLLIDKLKDFEGVLHLLVASDVGDCSVAVEGQGPFDEVYVVVDSFICVKLEFWFSEGDCYLDFIPKLIKVLSYHRPSTRIHRTTRTMNNLYLILPCMMCSSRNYAIRDIIHRDLISYRIDIPWQSLYNPSSCCKVNRCCRWVGVNPASAWILHWIANNGRPDDHKRNISSVLGQELLP